MLQLEEVIKGLQGELDTACEGLRVANIAMSHVESALSKHDQSLRMLINKYGQAPEGSTSTYKSEPCDLPTSTESMASTATILRAVEVPDA